MCQVFGDSQELNAKDQEADLEWPKWCGCDHGCVSMCVNDQIVRTCQLAAKKNDGNGCEEHGCANGQVVGGAGRSMEGYVCVKQDCFLWRLMLPLLSLAHPREWLP